MKKVIYFATLIFSLVLMSASCEKDDTTPDVKKTLEQLNPDWSSLTWNKTVVSSNGASVSYPKLSFTIVGNVITRILIDTDNTPMSATYIDIVFSGNVVTLTPDPIKTGGDPIKFTWQKIGNQIKLNEGNAGLGAYNYYLDI